MNRGDVYWVDFEPATGSEIRKIRPAVIVSNDSANARLARVQVVPLTSRVHKVYPSECMIDCKGTQSKAMADQIMTVDKRKVHEKICTVTAAEMTAVERCIQIQLLLVQPH